MSKSTAKKKTVASKPKTPKAATAKPVHIAASTEFVLHTGRDVPVRTRAPGASPYPFAAMEVGQHFTVDATVDDALYTDANELHSARVEELRKVANRLSGATLRFTKRHSEYKFAVRMLPDEGKVGVWRVETK